MHFEPKHSFPIVKLWALLHVQFFKTWKLLGSSERRENCVVVMPFSLVMRYQHFVGTWYPSLHVILDDCDTSPYNATEMLLKVWRLFAAWPKVSNVIFRAHRSSKHTLIHDGFGGLVVSILAAGTRVRGFKPGRSRWIFLAYAFLRRGSKIMCPMAQLCGLQKNLVNFRELRICEQNSLVIVPAFASVWCVAPLEMNAGTCWG